MSETKTFVGLVWLGTYTITLTSGTIAGLELLVWAFAGQTKPFKFLGEWPGDDYDDDWYTAEPAYQDKTEY